MANNGWDGQLKADRWDENGCFGTGTGSAPHGEWFDARKVTCPSTVGDQRRANGWTRLEMPVDNDEDSPGDLRSWQLPTGSPGGEYNTAAQEPLST